MLTRAQRKLAAIGERVRRQLVVEQLQRVARPLMRPYMRTPTNCIASTRIVIETLAHFEIAAEPIACRVIVRNAVDARMLDAWERTNRGVEPPPIMRNHWLDLGGWSIGIGFGGDGVGFDGHLVAFVPSLGVTIDASIDQCDRPDRNIGPLPGVLVVPWDVRLASGIAGDDVDGHGTRVIYERVERNDFERAPDWRDADVSAAVAALVVAVRAAASQDPITERSTLL